MGDLKVFNKQVRDLLMHRFSALIDAINFAGTAEMVFGNAFAIISRTIFFN